MLLLLMLLLMLLLWVMLGLGLGLHHPQRWTVGVIEMRGRWSPSQTTTHRWEGMTDMGLVVVGVVVAIILKVPSCLPGEGRGIEGHGPSPLGRLVGHQRARSSRVMFELLLENGSGQRKREGVFGKVRVMLG